MINMTFSIEDFPSDWSQSYSLVAGVEGEFSVERDDRVFFREQGILLLELSQEMESWIAEVDFDGTANFYYTSMDFEEEPILAFSYDLSKGLYHLESVWSVSELFVSKDELVNACKFFINKLSSEVQARKHRNQRGQSEPPPV